MLFIISAWLYYILFDFTNNSLLNFVYILGSLNSKIASYRRALVQCTDTIVESNIDPFVLARKAYSKEIISEDVYKIVKDKKTGDTGAERLDKVLDDIKDHIKHDPNVLSTFLNILRDDLNRTDLADEIISKLKLP